MALLTAGDPICGLDQVTRILPTEFPGGATISLIGAGDGYSLRYLP